MAFDIDNGEDFLAESGLTLAWRYAKRLKKGGLGWFQPECASWLPFLSAGSHKRKFNENISCGSQACGAGDTNSEFVREGNETAYNLAAIIDYLIKKDVFVVFETTCGSKAAEFGPYKFALSKLKSGRQLVHACRYGWREHKRLWLYSNLPNLDPLMKKCNHPTHAKLTDIRNGSVVSKALALKRSGLYRKAFARAAVRTFLQTRD